MMRKTLQISLIILVCLSCGKQKPYQVDFSSSVSNIEVSSVTLNATIESEQELEVQGLLYSIDTMLSVSDNFLGYQYAHYYSGEYNYFGKILDTELQSVQSYDLSNLLPARTYYYKLFTVHEGLVQYSELDSFATGCPGLGCGPARGQIIYSDGNGGGIEIANINGLIGENWGCVNNFIGAGETAVGTGKSNSETILDSCGINTLAKLCDDYTQNGFSDYYMPSIDELKLINNEVYLKAGNPFLYASGYYYSSSEVSSNACLVLQFGTGTVNTIDKGKDYFFTIPVRSF